MKRFSGFLPGALAFSLAGVTLMILSGSGCATPSKPNGPVAAGALQELQPMSFSRQWTANLDLHGDQVKELFVRDDYIFVYTRDNAAYGMKRGSGEVVIPVQAAPPATTLFPPVVLNDRVVFPTPGILRVFDKEGNRKPSISLQYAMRTPAVGYPTAQHIFYGAAAPGGYGRVICVDAAKTTGSTEPVWTYLTKQSVRSTPAYFQGAVYTGADDGTVAAVNADTAAPIWPLPGGVFDAAGRIRADMRADEQGVYVATDSQSFYCLEKANGKVKWQFHAPESLDEDFWVSPTTVYLPVGPNLVALDKSTGDYTRKPKWTLPGKPQYLAEDDKYTYLRDNSDYIIAVDRATGKQMFRSKRNDFVAFGHNVSGPAAKGPNGIVYAGVIYAATRTGQVYAITPVLKSGTIGELVMDWQPGR